MNNIEYQNIMSNAIVRTCPRCRNATIIPVDETWYQPNPCEEVASDVAIFHCIRCGKEFRVERIPYIDGIKFELQGLLISNNGWNI